METTESTYVQNRLARLERQVADLLAAMERPARRVYRLRHVLAATGLSRATIYRKEAAGDFPPHFALGDGSVGWAGEAVDQWIADRIEDSAELRRLRALRA